MRRVLAQTFAIQSLGVVAMLLTTLLVARLGGPGAQGSFALVKSINDLQVSLCSLGLPPAIIFMLNKTGSGHRRLARLALYYMLALAVVLPLVTAGLLGSGGLGHGGWALVSQAALIGWGSALLTAFALYRALVLVHNDGPIFSLVSILQWLIVLAAAALLLNRSAMPFEIAYFTAGAVSMAVVGVVVARHHSTLPAEPGKAPIAWSILRRQSGHVLAQAGLYAAQPFISTAALVAADPSRQLAGFFNVASMAITLPNLLVSLVAPVLFNRWSKSLDWAHYAVIRRRALGLGLAGQAAALLALPIVPMVIGAIFGARFAMAAAPVAVLALSVLAVFTTRILSPALQGLGRNDIVSWSCAARLGAGCAAGAAAWIGGAPPLIAAAWAWCLGEYAALAVLIARGRSSAA